MREEKKSSGSARIPVPPPPALHRRADYHPAHHRPHMVQLAVHHDVSIRAEDVAALADLPVHGLVETFDNVHPEPHHLFLSSVIIFPVSHKSILLVLLGFLQSSQVLLTTSVSPKLTLTKVFAHGVSLAKGWGRQRWSRKHHHLPLPVHLGAWALLNAGEAIAVTTGILTKA